MKQGVLKKGAAFVRYALWRPNEGAFAGKGQTQDGAEQSAAAAQYEQPLRVEFAPAHQAEGVDDAGFPIIGSGILKEQAKRGRQFVGADGFRAWRHRGVSGKFPTGLGDGHFDVDIFASGDAGADFGGRAERRIMGRF